MPFYDYKCHACSSVYEALRSFSDLDETVECPSCKAVGTSERLVSVPGRAKVRGGTGAGKRAW